MLIADCDQKLQLPRTTPWGWGLEGGGSDIVRWLYYHHPILPKWTSFTTVTQLERIFK